MAFNRKLFNALHGPAVPVSTRQSKVVTECWRTNIGGFYIVLRQGKLFSLQYGKQHKTNLSYADACTELGGAIMHALACESKLDNSED